VKVSLFVWRLLRNRQPSKDNLLRQNIIHANDSACVNGCGVTETATHLFLDCDLSYSMWLLVWNWKRIAVVAPCQIRDHCIPVSFMAGMPRGTYSFFKVI